MNLYDVTDPDILRQSTEAYLAALRNAETDCYNDMAAAIRSHFPGIEITGAQVAGRVAELLRAEEKLQESDCPNCAKYPCCEYNQGRHGVVRINCPLWRAKR